MTDYSSNNRRIAKNTMFLYIRMIVMMLVSLFTFRELLKELGVSEYGTYNVIGGIVVLFSFLSSAMTQSNQRYLSFNLGKGNIEESRGVFSMILNIQILLSVVILILSESIGLWFVNAKMNFSGVSSMQINMVYQFTILTFFIQLIQIPFTSSIISYEKMHFFSYISIGEAFLRLGVVFSLKLFDCNRLIWYTILLSISAIIIFSIYSIYCFKRLPICKYQFNRNPILFRKLIGFSSWNMLGGLGNVGANQGVNILLNIFCGVVANASMGVSQQVNSAVASLVNNVQTAFNPQIIKSFAGEDRKYFISLIFKASRISFFLIFIVGVPLITLAEDVLRIWLTSVPEYASSFVRLIIVYCMIDALAGSLWTANQASGNIRNYMIIISIITLLNVPITYILLKNHFPPVYALIVRVAINFIVLNFRVLYLKKSINFPALRFYKNVIIRAIASVLLIYPIAIYIANLAESASFIRQIFFVIILVFSALVAGAIFLLDSSERRFIFAKVKQTISHK